MDDTLTLRDVLGALEFLQDPKNKPIVTNTLDVFDSDMFQKAMPLDPTQKLEDKTLGRVADMLKFIRFKRDLENVKVVGSGVQENQKNMNMNFKAEKNKSCTSNKLYEENKNLALSSIFASSCSKGDNANRTNHYCYKQKCFEINSKPNANHKFANFGEDNFGEDFDGSTISFWDKEKFTKARVLHDTWCSKFPLGANEDSTFTVEDSTFTVVGSHNGDTKTVTLEEGQKHLIIPKNGILIVGSNEYPYKKMNNFIVELSKWPQYGLNNGDKVRIKNTQPCIFYEVDGQPTGQTTVPIESKFQLSVIYPKPYLEYYLWLFALFLLNDGKTWFGENRLERFMGVRRPNVIWTTGMITQLVVAVLHTFKQFVLLWEKQIHEQGEKSILDTPLKEFINIIRPLSPTISQFPNQLMYRIIIGIYCFFQVAINLNH